MNLLEEWALAGMGEQGRVLFVFSWDWVTWDLGGIFLDLCMHVMPSL